MDPRKRDLAAIHATVKNLGMDDETYRRMLWSVARVTSAADLDFVGRKNVLDHLRSRGGQFVKPKSATGEWAFIDNASEATKPLLRKICAVCRSMGVGKAYAEGVARRQHGIERHLEMMSTSELWMVAGALERTRLFKAASAPPPEGGLGPAERMDL